VLVSTQGFSLVRSRFDDLSIDDLPDLAAASAGTRAELPCLRTRATVATPGVRRTPKKGEELL
jgi:hypothetical protein